MFPASAFRKSFQNRLTASQRLSLDQLSAALASRCTREAVQGDRLQFLKSSTNRTAPVLPLALVEALVRYGMIDPIYQLAVGSNAKDPIDDMSTHDQLLLQQAMEKKSQLETLISNVMKSAQQTQSAIVGNVRAS